MKAYSSVRSLTPVARQRSPTWRGSPIFARANSSARFTRRLCALRVRSPRLSGEIAGHADRGARGLEQLDPGGDPLRPPLLEADRLARGDLRQPLSPREEPAHRASGSTCSISTPRGSRNSVSRPRAARCAPSSCADTRNVTLSHPASATNPTSAPGSAASTSPARTGRPFTVPRARGPNATQAKQTLAHARAGPHPAVGRVEDDRRVLETDDHAAGAQRPPTAAARRPDRAARSLRRRRSGR